MDAVKKQNQIIELSDVSGGANSVEYPIKIGPMQVQPETNGCMLKKSGIVKYSGCEGLFSGTPFTKPLRMLDIYRDYNGGETLLAISNGILSTVNRSTGAVIPKYSMGGILGEGWKTEAYGKAFICNGQTVVKMEFGGGVFPVGIAAPVGSDAVANAGGTLPLPGDYSVIVGYSRMEGTSNKLYSQGETLPDVTIDAVNLSIKVTIPNSTDPQVNNKIIWVKAPGDAVHYLSYQTLDNVTTEVILSDLTQKNASIVYESNALFNGRPPYNSSYIFFFADRIWTIVGNVIYYSNQGKFSPYDLEVFDPSNYITTGNRITGLFSIGTNLYANTNDGILIIPNADPNAINYIIEPRWHFADMRTVGRWNNGAIGLTNDGVRYFDGQGFSNYDLAYTIKSKISVIYGASRDFHPCGFVFRRSFRNEYHLLWQDPSISTEVNNVHAILNLDTAYWNSPVDYNMAWEFQPYSANYAVVSRSSNDIFYGQSHTAAPKVYKESNVTDQSINVYNALGVLLTELTNHKMLLRTRIYMPLINGMCWLKRVHLLAIYAVPYIFRVVIADKKGRITTEDTVPVGNDNDPKYDVVNHAGTIADPYVNPDAIFDIAIFPYTDTDVIFRKLPDAIRGRTFYIEIEQTANDPSFQLLAAQLMLDIETGNFL